MNRFKKILCTLGNDDSDDRLLERAIDLALKHQAEITVADVIKPVPAGWLAFDQHDSGSRIEAARRQRLENAVAPYRTK